MTGYFPTSTSVLSENGFRLKTRERIDEYVKHNYKPDSPSDDVDVQLISRINRNSWEARYNINLENEEELRELVNVILEIVEEANNEFKQKVEENIADNLEQRGTYDCNDVYVFIEVVTTDRNDEHDWYTPLGNGSSPSDISEFNIDELGDILYPLPALDVSVKFSY